MPRRKIPIASQEQVRERAKSLCEYCHTLELWQYVPFTVDHVVPLNKGGTDTLSNLALACFHCNRRKADKTVAVDPDSGEEAPLYNPRQHHWYEHFIWSADKVRIIGLTPTGSATVALLDLNRERIVSIRLADVLVDRHPPAGDPMQEANK